MRWLLPVVAACAPADDPIGETLWQRRSGLETSGDVGAGGHLVRHQGTANASIEVFAPTGELVWRVPCEGPCGFDQVIDADGNVFGSAQDAREWVLSHRSAENGTVTWSRRIEAVRAHVALADDGTVWWFAHSMAAIDFGGGPVVPSPAGTAFGLFRPADGAYVASGTLDVVVGRVAPLPAGGFVTISAGELVAFDTAGVTRWRHGIGVLDFAVHEDGEVTYREGVDGRPLEEADYDIVRIDANQQERWREPGIGSAEGIVALSDGRALLAGLDSLAGPGTSDASFLALFDRDGYVRREVRSAEGVFLYRSRTRDGFRFFETHEGEGDATLIARRAP